MHLRHPVTRVLCVVCTYTHTCIWLYMSWHPTELYQIYLLIPYLTVRPLGHSNTHTHTSVILSLHPTKLCQIHVLTSYSTVRPRGHSNTYAHTRRLYMSLHPTKLCQIYILISYSTVRPLGHSNTHTHKGYTCPYTSRNSVKYMFWYPTQQSDLWDTLTHTHTHRLHMSLYPTKLCQICIVTPYQTVRPLGNPNTHTHTELFMFKHTHTYGVATISRLLKIIGLFCKRAL